jgi:hypothetical protein
VITYCSITLESHPEEKNINRAETPISAWFIRQTSDTQCKVTFVSEIDFKLSMFIAK